MPMVFRREPCPQMTNVEWYEEHGDGPVQSLLVATFWPDSTGNDLETAAENAWLSHLAGIDTEAVFIVDADWLGWDTLPEGHYVNDRIPLLAYLIAERGRNGETFATAIAVLSASAQAQAAAPVSEGEREDAIEEALAKWQAAYPRLFIEGPGRFPEDEGGSKTRVHMVTQFDRPGEWFGDLPSDTPKEDLHMFVARVLLRRPGIEFVELGSPDDGGPREDYDWEIPKGDPRHGIASGFVLTSGEYLHTLRVDGVMS